MWHHFAYILDAALGLPRPASAPTQTFFYGMPQFDVMSFQRIMVSLTIYDALDLLLPGAQERRSPGSWKSPLPGPTNVVHFPVEKLTNYYVSNSK